MRFLTLTIKVDESVKGYDFISGEGDLSYQDVVEGLEFALFGNDALFGGEIILTAEYENNNYVIKRDFARGTALVTLDGGLLSPERTQLLLNNLSGLGLKQWRKNTENTDYASYLADFSSYVEKYLSALGFTEEELEWRSSAYDRKNDRILAQVEVLDELVDESLPARADEKRKAIRALNDELMALSPISGADREEAASRLAELEKRLSTLKEEEEIYIDKTCALEASRRNARNENILKRIDELKKEMEEYDSELSPLTAELDEKERVIDDKKNEYADARKDFETYDDRANALREEFFKMAEENKSSGEITAAVLEKTETDGVNDEEIKKEFLSWNDKYNALSKELKDTHVDFAKRRSVREGLAFETALDDMEAELRSLNDGIDRDERLIASMQEEIRSLNESGDEGSDFFTLYKYKTLYEVYRSEIAAEEKKIRENESARKKYAEDISALEKAKQTLLDYVAGCEDKEKELIDRITGLKTRISFYSDVDEMEYGDVCPVCNGRITAKADHAKELDNLRSCLSAAETELDENRKSAKEHRDKALAIDVRLSAVKEKDRISGVYIDSLNASVSRKQNEQNEMLSSVGADNFAHLERLCRSAAASRGNGLEGMAQINFLKAKIKDIEEDKEAAENKAKDLKNNLDEMREAYKTEILPPMDGRRAYSLLEETVGTEQKEDEIIADLIDADSQRSLYLSYILTGEVSAPSIVNATADVFIEIAEEIKKNDELRKEAVAKMQASEDEIKALEDEFNEKIAKADELMAKIEGDKLCIQEMTEIVGEENATAILFSEEEENALAKDIDDYYAKVRFLEEKIAETKAALPAENFDRETYDTKQKELDVLTAELDDIEKRLATSNAAVDLACAKTAQCDVLINNSKLVKKLADGDVADVILPVLNDALSLAGEDVTASADGLGIKFSTPSKKGPRTISYDDVAENVLHTAIECTLNYVLRLATDKETVKLLSVEKRGEETIAAIKYGVILL